MIGEAVLYNFTLTSYTIRNHFENTKSGLRYFGSRPFKKELPSSLYLQLPPSQWIEIDMDTGQPISILKPQ